MAFRDNPAWLTAARALGLQLHEGGSFVSGASFLRLKRSMGRPVGEVPNTRQWMHGMWPIPHTSERKEVLVLVDVRSVGSSTYIETHTLARVTPPLFYGLSLGSQNWFTRSFQARQGTGDPRFDDAFRFDALDPGRSRQLFIPRIVALMLPMSALHVHVTDSCVDIRSDDVELDVMNLTRRLNTATAVAHALATRRSEIPPSGGELALKERWSVAAGAQGMAFEPARFRIHGRVGALSTRIALEGEPQMLGTVLSAMLPAPLGISLKLFEQGPLSFLATLFGTQDIVLGDPAFDRMFVVQGQEAGVRTLLASPDLRRALHSLVVGADGFTIDDTRVIVRWPAAFEPPQLRNVIDHVRRLDRGFAPRVPRGGAYR
jgi:hypothetical protein